MRVACVLIPRFPLAVELLAHPEFRSRPVVLGGAPEERAVVIECSAWAEQAGVRRGMQLREALARCHNTVFLERHPLLYAELFAEMLDALERVSPIVEGSEPGCAFVDLTGLPGTGDAIGEVMLVKVLLRVVQDAVGLIPRAGIADGRFAAWAAAASLSKSTGAQRSRIVPPGEASAFVASLPVDRLPLSGEMLRRLRWLGLRTAGELAALPREALADQFGMEGTRAWDLAHGDGSRPLMPRRHPPEVSDHVDFPQPVTEVSALLAAARHLLGRLLRRPECMRRAVRGLELTALLSNGHRRQWTLTFREPTSNQERMHRALAAKLDGAAFPAPAEMIELRLRDLCGETGVQHSLFSAHARHLRSLDAALAHVRARFGRQLVMKLIGVEPCSRFPERQYALIPVGTGQMS